MKSSHRLFLITILLCLITSSGKAQSLSDNTSSRLPDIYLDKEDNIESQFRAKGFAWPAHYIYIRSFKYESQLELWVKNTRNEPYKLFKTYHICMQSGSMGPKRFEGDFQVPEGLYHINDFNPNSLYHLSLGLNYPNSSDRVFSDSLHPGGDIYIHGNCVSVGCVALSDEDIEEVYIIANSARENGLEFIPVHVFPVRYNNRRSAEYLANELRNRPMVKTLESSLKDVFDYFNDKKQLPLVMINSKGQYIIN